MSKETRVIKDPFLGEVTVTKLGETSMNMVGETVVNTISVDKRGNFWIETWDTIGGDPIPPTFLPSRIVELISELKQDLDE